MSGPTTLLYTSFKSAFLQRLRRRLLLYSYASTGWSLAGALRPRLGALSAIFLGLPRTSSSSVRFSWSKNGLQMGSSVATASQLRSGLWPPATVNRKNKTRRAAAAASTAEEFD